jgi:hypothetical protein
MVASIRSPLSITPVVNERFRLSNFKPEEVQNQASSIDK